MVETEERTSPFDRFLFPRIFRSFRLAIQPSTLAIAFVAVTAICLTGWLMDLSRTGVTAGSSGRPAAGQLAGTGPQDQITELDLYVTSHVQLQELLASPPLADSRRMGVFKTLCQFCAAQCRRGNVRACLDAVTWAFTYHTAYSVLFSAVTLVVLSLAGGAICRIAALQSARNERLTLAEATRFAWTRRNTLIATPIAPLAIAFLLGLPILLFGLVGNIPWVGELLLGLLFPLALVAAFFIAIVLVGTAAGQILLFPAIAYEDSDFFDAISRSFSNVYGRPWKMAFYTLVAILYGTVCCLVVRLFAFVALWATHAFLQLGLREEKLRAIWPEPTFAHLLGPFPSPEGWSLWLAALLVRIGVLAVVGLTISFVVSFYFSAGTVIYALMRNCVDGTSLDEVYVAPEEAAETSE